MILYEQAGSCRSSQCSVPEEEHEGSIRGGGVGSSVDRSRSFIRVIQVKNSIFGK